MTDTTLKQYSVIITLIVLISFAGNMLYASYQVIPEPLFTQVNDELVYNETFEDRLTISYITNKSDTRRLESISFEGLERPQLVSQNGYFGGFISMNDANENPYNDILGRYYTLKSGFIDLLLSENDIKRMEENGSLTFGEGSALMNDGSTIPISLGRVTIHSVDHWENYRLRMGGGGSDDHYSVEFETKTPILIESLDVSSFGLHKEAIDLEFTVDSKEVYTYYELINRSEPIEVNQGFQVTMTAKEVDVPSQWRFNMISMDFTYEKEGEIYDSWIYYPFYGIGMDEATVEAYVDLWRTQHE